MAETKVLSVLIAINLFATAVLLNTCNAESNSKKSQKHLKQGPNIKDFIPENEPSEADRQYLKKFKKATYNLESFAPKYDFNELNSIGNDLKYDKHSKQYIKKDSYLPSRFKKSIFNLNSHRNFPTATASRAAETQMMPSYQTIFTNSESVIPIRRRHILDNEQQQQQYQQLHQHSSGRIRKSIPDIQAFASPCGSSSSIGSSGYEWCNEFENCGKRSNIGFIPQYPDPCPVIKEVVGPSCPYQQQQQQRLLQPQPLRHPETYSYPHLYPLYGTTSSCGC